MFVTELVKTIKKGCDDITELIGLILKYKDGIFAYKLTIVIVFIFLLIPDVPYIISNKLPSLVNKEYMEYIQIYTLPLIEWLVETNFRLVIIWLIPLAFRILTIKIFGGCGILEAISNRTERLNKKIITAVFGPSLIISCIILDATLIYVSILKGFAFPQKIWAIADFYTATNESSFNLGVAFLPLVLTLFITLDDILGKQPKENIKGSLRKD